MKIDKPAGLASQTIIFRPTKELNGRYAIGLVLEYVGQAKNQAVAVEWCGGRGFWTFAGFTGCARSLRLPKQLHPTDVFVLKILAAIAMRISVTIHAQDGNPDDIATELDNGDSDVVTVCADPLAPDNSPLAEDILASGYFPAPAKHLGPLFRIRALRAFPEGAVLHIPLRRPNGVVGPNSLMVRTSVGEQRRCILIPAEAVGAVASFRLKPLAADELWPVVLHAQEALEWSAIARRGFDPIILPAFSLERG